MSAARCFHCHEPLAGSTLHAQLGTVTEPVCCVGCQAVAELVAGSGLQDFYQRRNGASPRPGTMSDRWSAYADPQLAAQFTTSHGNTVSVLLIIEGLRCSACAWLIERSLTAHVDVRAVCVNAASGHAQVGWRTGTQPLAEIMRGIAQLGYVPHLLSADAQAQVQRQERRGALKQLAVATFGMMQVMMFAVADYAAQLSSETLEPRLAQYSASSACG
jgi:Cu2+-exporting ATPase